MERLKEDCSSRIPTKRPANFRRGNIKLIALSARATQSSSKSADKKQTQSNGLRALRSRQLDAINISAGRLVTAARA